MSQEGAFAEAQLLANFETVVALKAVESQSEVEMEINQMTVASSSHCSWLCSELQEALFAKNADLITTTMEKLLLSESGSV